MCAFTPFIRRRSFDSHTHPTISSSGEVPGCNHNMQREGRESSSTRKKVDSRLGHGKIVKKKRKRVAVVCVEPFRTRFKRARGGKKKEEEESFWWRARKLFLDDLPPYQLVHVTDCEHQFFVVAFVILLGLKKKTFAVGQKKSRRRQDDG